MSKGAVDEQSAENQANAHTYVGFAQRPRLTANARTERSLPPYHRRTSTPIPTPPDSIPLSPRRRPPTRHSPWIQARYPAGPARRLATGTAPETPESPPPAGGGIMLSGGWHSGCQTRSCCQATVLPPRNLGVDRVDWPPSEDCDGPGCVGAVTGGVWVSRRDTSAAGVARALPPGARAVDRRCLPRPLRARVTHAHVTNRDHVLEHALPHRQMPRLCRPAAAPPHPRQ